MVQSQLLAYAVLALAERGDPPSHRRHMLPDGQVEAFHEGRIDLPAARCQHLLDRLERAEHHAVRHAHQAPPACNALSSAKSSSNWTCVTRTSCKKYWEKAAAWSATSTNQCSTVLGSTLNTRATARMPKPSARAPIAHTRRSGETRFP